MGKSKKSKKSLQDTFDESACSKVEEMDVGNQGIISQPIDEAEEYAALCKDVNPIAKPLANRKLAKKIYKLVKKSAKNNSMRQGIKETRKALRKGEKGIMVLAGDVTPIDIYCHVPAQCEELDIPYVFTPSRQHLGLAAGHRRPAVLILVKRDDANAEVYDGVEGAVKLLPPPYAS